MTGNRPRLYVGNLPYQLTIDELKEFFAGAGTVTDAAIITDRDSGRSKGFGFVEFATDEDANRAQTMFNGAQAQESHAQSRPRQTAGRQGGRSSRRRRWRERFRVIIDALHEPRQLTQGVFVSR